MPTTINASNTSGGAIITPDGSGVLELQSGGVTGLTVSGANVTVAGTLTATGGLAALTSPVSVIGNATAGAEIRLPEDTDNGANYVAIKAPNALAANLTFTLPTADGTNGQFIRTDGAGQLSFATVSPGGTTGQIQFNNAGVFGGVTAVPVANGGTGATTLTANNVLLGNGTSAVQAVAPGTAGNLLTSNGTTWTSAPSTSGSISANAANNVTIRQPLIVQSDGTVTPVTGSGPSISGEFLLGGQNPAWSRVAYSPTDDRFLIAYYNTNGAVWCVVAQVTVSSVTYGTPVQVSPGESCWQVEVSYNSTSNRFVIAYFSNTQGGVQVHAVSVSNLTPTIGTRVGIASSQNGYAALASHPSAATMLIGYVDSGEQIRALEFTISGTTISFSGANGSTGKYGAFGVQQTSRNLAVAYCGTVVSGFNWAIAYSDSSNRIQIFLISMSGGQPSSIGSNTQISSFGQSPTIIWDTALSRLVISSRDTVATTTVANPPVISATAQVYNPPNGTITPVHMYRDTTANVYTVVFRNTSVNNFLQTVNFTITASALTVLSSVRTISTDSTDWMGSAFSSSIGRGLVVWGSTSLLKSSIINSATVTNLTTTNFVGFAGATVTAGQSVSVQIIGSSVAGFSGFTPATPYYVRIDGTLATTPDPSLASPVYAGLALSASSLLVKG